MINQKLDRPLSWDDVLGCPCGGCVALGEIYRRCVSLEEPLFVCDCRMYGRGFQVADVGKLFVSPATLGVDFDGVAPAVAFVLDQQDHCDGFLSSWPFKLAIGGTDWAWRVETFSLEVPSHA